MKKCRIVLLAMTVIAVAVIFAGSCGRSTTTPPTTYTVTPAPYTVDPSRAQEARVPWLDVATYVDPAQNVVVRVGDRFAIGLYVNPRVGYHWAVEFDDAFLGNLDRQVVMINPGTPVDGTDWYLFSALKGGHTEVSFRLLHTGQLRGVTSFEVAISP